MEAKLTYTVVETARLLGLSRASCYQALRAGELPSVRVGRRYLIPKATLLKLLSEAGQAKDN